MDVFVICTPCLCARLKRAMVRLASGRHHRHLKKEIVRRDHYMFIILCCKVRPAGMTDPPRVQRPVQEERGTKESLLFTAVE